MLRRLMAACETALCMYMTRLAGYSVELGSLADILLNNPTVLMENTQKVGSIYILQCTYKNIL